VERLGKKQIIVSLGAILAAKRPQQEKWKNNHLEQPTPMRTSNVQAIAEWTASQKIKSIVRHGRR
jgi:hypothetical protein